MQICIFETSSCINVKMYTKGMSQFSVREHQRASTPALSKPPVGFSIVKKKPKQPLPPTPIKPSAISTLRQDAPQPMPPRVQRQISHTQHTIAEHQTDQRFQHELKEMEGVNDLRKIDDDVEDAATLFEWHALEHNHHPQTAGPFITLAITTTVACALMLAIGNIIGALTIGLAGFILFHHAQKPPRMARYRLMVDGVALNNILYHYRDLERFNIIYEPGHTKTIILHSKNHFTPLIHVEIGNADPVFIRDILLEFVREDLNLEESLADIVARRVGF